MHQQFWLFVSDPADYHWDTLFIKGKELWNGIRGTIPLRFFKHVRKGDKILCYHGSPDRLVYGLAVAASDAYPDPRDSKKKLWVVDLKATERLPRAVSYQELKRNPRLKKMKFLRMPRLSISSLRKEEYDEILRMGGVPTTPSLFG